MNSTSLAGNQAKRTSEKRPTRLLFCTANDACPINGRKLAYARRGNLMRIEASLVKAVARVSVLIAMLSSCSDQNCSPGAFQSCAGPGACPGVQTCAADGSVWSLCDCGAGLYGAGGSPSTGGAMGSGSQGGSNLTGGMSAVGGVS